MIENKTSEAVKHFAKYEEPFTMTPAEFHDIAAKYQRMEEALHYYRDMCGYGACESCGATSDRAYEALSLDPLADA